MRAAPPVLLQIVNLWKSDPLSPRERDRVRGKGMLYPPRRQNDAGVSNFEQIEGLVEYSAPLPLTPGEREKLPARAERTHRRGKSSRARSPLDRGPRLDGSGAIL